MHVVGSRPSLLRHCTTAETQSVLLWCASRRCGGCPRLGADFAVLLSSRYALFYALATNDLELSQLTKVVVLSPLSCAWSVCVSCSGHVLGLAGTAADGCVCAGRCWRDSAGELEKMHVAEAQPEDVDRSQGGADLRPPTVRQARSGEGEEISSVMIYAYSGVRLREVHSVRCGRHVWPHTNCRYCGGVLGDLLSPVPCLVTPLVSGWAPQEGRPESDHSSHKKHVEREERRCRSFFLRSSGCCVLTSFFSDRVYVSPFSSCR